MCNGCGNQETKCSCKKEEEIPVVIQQFTDDVFFSSCNVNDKLENLKLPLGTDLTTILKKIDFKFGDNANSVNFSAFSLNYLFSRYTIKNIKQFAEAISLEFGTSKGKFFELSDKFDLQQTAFSNIYNDIQILKKPGIVDNANIGFTITSNLQEVLQKIVEKFNSVLENSNTEIPFSVESTETLGLTIALSANGRKIKGNVKVSLSQNNALKKFPDGLFVSDKINNVKLPVLEIIANRIGIVGGDSVQLPIQGLQNLDVIGNTLTISGANSVILPTTEESPLVVHNSNTIRISQAANSNHNITADSIISTNPLNRLFITTDGLAVLMNAADVLSQISASPVLKEAFKILVNAALQLSSFKWAIENRGTLNVPVSYIDSNNLLKIATVAPNTTYDLTASRLLTFSSSTLLITFQGK